MRKKTFAPTRKKKTSAKKRIKTLRPDIRAMAYSMAFPKYPPLRTDSRWLDGVWFMGNTYKGSGYHGAYPPSYVKRIMALFPEVGRVLHLFSGSLTSDTLSKDFPGQEHVRFDCRSEVKPDVCAEVCDIKRHIKKKSFDLILADPPYTDEDASHYGTCLVARNTVVRDVRELLRIGGNLVWLDQVLPMYRKDVWLHWGAIGVVRSTNHRFRMVSMFERVK